MNRDILRRVVQVFFSLLFQGALLFASAGTFDWLWGWIFLATGVGILSINFFVIPREVIEERGRKKTNVKRWDRVITTLVAFPLFGIFVVSGFDHRLGWSGEIPVACRSAALLLYFAASMLFTWSMVSNQFFSTMVRIQSERAHTVESGGPYRFVRHPGYVGFIMTSLATPIALGSVYAISMAAIVAILFVIRTALEDQTLMRELDGYREYASRVRYRLCPYIW